MKLDTVYCLWHEAAPPQVGELGEINLNRLHANLLLYVNLRNLGDLPSERSLVGTPVEKQNYQRQRKICQNKLIKENELD